MNRGSFPVVVVLCWALLVGGVPRAIGQSPGEQPERAEMAGYLLVPHSRIDPGYNAGFSMYVAAWPLLKNYPGLNFQSGLFGTWMFAQLGKPKPEKI